MSGEMEFTTQIYVNQTLKDVKQIGPNDPQYTFRYFGLSIAFFTVFVGGIGNLMTILAFTSNSKLRTSFTMFLINLSCVDLITSILMIPFHIAGYVQLEWPFGNESWTARLQAYSYFCCGYSSIVFLVAITTNRLIGVLAPSKYKAMFNETRMRLLLVFCWTFAPIMLLPFLVGWHPDCPTPGHALTGFRTQQLLCTFVCLKGGWMLYMQFTRVLFQFLPLIYMVVAYSIIFAQVHGKRENMNRKMSSVSLNSTSTFNASITSKDKIYKKPFTNTRKSSAACLAKRRKEDARMLLVSLAICIGFMITFLPSVIVNLIPGHQRFGPLVHMAASNLSWFNSAINPLIYVVLNKRYRKEYLRVLYHIFGAKLAFDSESGTAIPGRLSAAASSFSESNNGTNKIVKDIKPI